MAKRRIPLLTELIIFGFFLSLYVLIFRGEFYTMDEMARYGLTKTMVLEKDLTITKANGTSFYCPYPILQSVASVPLYMLGELVVGDTGPMVKEKSGRLYVTLFNSIITALTCVIFFRLCLCLAFRERSSLILTLIYGLCTITLPYARMFLSEPLTGFLLMWAALLALSSTRYRPRCGVLAGIVLALGAANNFLVVPVFGIFFIFFLFQKGEIKDAFKLETLKDIRLWGLIVFGVIAVAEILWYNNVRFGSYFHSAYQFYELDPNIVYSERTPGFSYPLIAGLYGFLFSPMRSIFIFSPPLLGALLLWPRFIRERRRPALFILSIILVFMLIYSKWFGWHGGYAWGPRYLVPVTGFMLIPFAHVIEEFSKLRKLWRFAVWALCVAGGYVQILPTLVHPAESYVRVLDKYGGLYYEHMILFLPQACSVVVQTKLLNTIHRLKDTDLYFLKHLNFGAHLIIMGILIAIFSIAAVLYIRALNQEE
jgi:hypothetical protein